MTDITTIPQRPSYHARGGASTPAALHDIAEAFRRWPLWLLMSWQDTKLRYRGSVLGPFWLTISMGVMILAMGFVYSRLLKTPANDYFPFLTLGLMQWTLMSTLMQDACITFIQSSAFIKQIRLPYMVYVMRTLTRNMIAYAHNFVVYILVALYFGIWPGEHFWLLLPGLALFLLNAMWVILLFALICARFRDLQPIITSLVQVVFFVTPVVWVPKLLDGYGWVFQLNPFYHMLELIRAPLLGHTPDALSYIYTSLTAIIGIAGTFIMFRRFRARIAYWV